MEEEVRRLLLMTTSVEPAGREATPAVALEERVEIAALSLAMTALAIIGKAVAMLILPTFRLFFIVASSTSSFWAVSMLAMRLPVTFRLPLTVTSPVSVIIRRSLRREWCRRRKAG